LQDYTHEETSASDDESEIEEEKRKFNEAEAAMAAAALAGAGGPGAADDLEAAYNPRTLPALVELDTMLLRWGPAHLRAALDAATRQQVCLCCSRAAALMHKL
jgi:hypothetical protein